MPRPNAAQLAYGSATVICSAVAMLLLSGTPTGVGVVVIGVAALALGLLVSLTVPLPRRSREARGTAAAAVPALEDTTAPSAEVPMAASPSRVRTSRLHTGAGAGVPRASRYSVRR
ncbi:hypothetical protein [Streptomyces sp. NBC_01497]|uniref:hypothetical protein n=1 Tax=Streptomyces sp. NBC_01497 TaxID=2903885 RepID=UPI002E2FA5C7|nr:hypothetical protein [Streptomyces sp. NBC_01497]